MGRGDSVDRRGTLDVPLAQVTAGPVQHLHPAVVAVRNEELTRVIDREPAGVEEVASTIALAADVSQQRHNARKDGEPLVAEVSCARRKTGDARSSWGF